MSNNCRPCVPDSDLAKLNHDVAFGRAGGRIIWQPRIQCWYHDKEFAGEPLPEGYEGLSLPDIYRELGCSDRLYSWFNGCFRQVEPPGIERIREDLNETDVKVTTVTPAGKQVRVDRRTNSSARSLHVKREVETEDELKVAAWIEEGSTWEWDQERYEQSLKEVGDLGAPTMYLPRMNMQDLYINKMGVERAIYALADWPETVEAYFRVLEESHDRLIDVINASPIDIINMGENVHATTLPLPLFLKYHLPACQRRCEKLHSAGKFVSSHWDGDCGPILPYAKETGLDAIEAITPKPQGDVTLVEIKEGLGDDLFLLDGLPAVYFDHTFSEEALVECTRKLIGMFAPKLILGISDELSSTGDIDRVRVVGDIVEEYNATR